MIKRWKSTFFVVCSLLFVSQYSFAQPDEDAPSPSCKLVKNGEFDLSQLTDTKLRIVNCPQFKKFTGKPALLLNKISVENTGLEGTLDLNMFPNATELLFEGNPKLTGFTGSAREATEVTASGCDISGRRSSPV